MSLNKTPNHLRQRSGRFIRQTPPGTPRRSSRPSPRPIEILHRSPSAPLFSPATGDGDDTGAKCQSPSSLNGGWFSRMHTFNDIFLSPSSSPLSQHSNGGYEKDAKVVITVTVEGSPGPIRTLVKLGTSVEDIIKLIVQKYGEEGRLPRLDKGAASSFDLHVSYFSFQCLDRSNTIGDVGSRNFYLRKSNTKSHRESFGTSKTGFMQGSSPKQSSPSMVVYPSFVTRKVGKFGRRMRKVLEVLGCLHSSA